METLFDLYTKRKELKEELKHVEKELFNQKDLFKNKNQVPMILYSVE